jgi:hypothetical protein
MSDPGLYRVIRDQIEGIWNANWAHPDVPVFWRENDSLPPEDPAVTPNFMRNEIDFGRERLIAFGGGPRANQLVKYGSIVLRVLSSRSLMSDDTTLDLLSDAEAIFRSRLEGDLAFIGGMSGYDVQAETGVENGVWYMRASLVVFEFRFIG